MARLGPARRGTARLGAARPRGAPCRRRREPPPPGASAPPRTALPAGRAPAPACLWAFLLITPSDSEFFSLAFYFRPFFTNKHLFIFKFFLRGAEFHSPRFHRFPRQAWGFGGCFASLPAALGSGTPAPPRALLAAGSEQGDDPGGARCRGARQSGGKVRHKRQALQDMARPLKQWLYKHRDNPYPTKTEKILLALGSQMTLVQVSNWFANARRRLKNTVRQPDLSWALRIKLYNKYVQGNAERLSVSSDDSCSEDGENPPRNHMNEGGYNKPVHHTVIKTESSVIKTGVRPETSANEDYVSPPKYKSSLLNRYLNDSLRHVMATNAAMMEKTRQRNHSGSFSSNEFEEELVSPSSSETEGNFVYRTETLENGPNKCES
ncbi:homeobox protein Mohawk isoform X2 [Ciconia boyciana]